MYIYLVRMSGVFSLFEFQQIEKKYNNLKLKVCDECKYIYRFIILQKNDKIFFVD